MSVSHGCACHSGVCAIVLDVRRHVSIVRGVARTRAARRSRRFVLFSATDARHVAIACHIHQDHRRHRRLEGTRRRIGSQETITLLRDTDASGMTPRSTVPRAPMSGACSSHASAISCRVGRPGGSSYASASHPREYRDRPRGLSEIRARCTTRACQTRVRRAQVGRGIVLSRSIAARGRARLLRQASA